MRLLSSAPPLMRAYQPARATFANTVGDAKTGEIAALKVYFSKLEAEVSELRTMMAKQCAELEVSAL